MKLTETDIIIIRDYLRHLLRVVKHDNIVGYENGTCLRLVNKITANFDSELDIKEVKK